MNKSFNHVYKKFNSTKLRFVSANKFKLFSESEGFERIDTFIGKINGMTYYTNTAPEVLKETQLYPQVEGQEQKKENHFLNLAMLSILILACAGLLGYIVHSLKHLGG